MNRLFAFVFYGMPFMERSIKSEKRVIADPIYYLIRRKWCGIRDVSDWPIYKSMEIETTNHGKLAWERIPKTKWAVITHSRLEVKRWLRELKEEIDHVCSPTA